MNELPLIDEPTAARLLALEEAMAAVERAFVAHAERRGPPGRDHAVRVDGQG